MWIHLSQLNLIWNLEKLNWTISTHRSIWSNSLFWKVHEVFSLDLYDLWDLRGTILCQTQIYYWAHVGTSVFRPGFYLLTWPRSPESKPASEICWYLMFVGQLCAAACSCLSTVEVLSAGLNAKVETALYLAGSWYFQSLTARGYYLSVMNSRK